MYGIFTQGPRGLQWCGNESTIETALARQEDYRAREDVDFVMVIPVAGFLDIEGEREAKDAD